MISPSPIPATFTILNLVLHTYGLLIGIGVVIALRVIEKEIYNLGKESAIFEKMALFILFFSLVSARLWHVFTDFYLYKNNYAGIFAIQQGGLSIVGALLGGGIAVPIGIKLFDKKKQYSWKLVTDVATFGIPFGQIIGRFGNYVNQELYGLPVQSNVVWKLYVEPKFRLSSVKDYEFFHPLFLYEIMALLPLLFITHHVRSKKIVTVGSGFFTVFYLWYYALVRFILDFIRIDTSEKIFQLIGTNQVVFLITFMVTSVLLYRYVNTIRTVPERG